MSLDSSMACDSSIDVKSKDTSMVVSESTLRPCATSRSLSRWQLLAEFFVSNTVRR